MSSKGPYTVRVWRDTGSDDCEFEYEYDTYLEAKLKAKYFLTDEFQRSAESSEPYVYAQVLRAGVDILKEYTR